MVKRFTKFLLFLLLFVPSITYSQTTLIYFEDFEATDTFSIHLNTGDVGTNSGPNLWEINSQYIGQPIFPNTIAEDSTFGGFITHPDSNYLHIHDVNVASVSNANFDPNLPSDRFATLGPFCTLGDDSVHFAFFYVCVGDTDAYGQVYYKADGGPWTLADSTIYSNSYKWRYADISDTAFSNHQSLEFGFRWINRTGTDTTTSFGIDDIKLVGTYDPVRYPVNITISQLYNVPVCQNNYMYVGFTLSTPLCGTGIYQVKVSGPGGDFSHSIVSNIYSLSNDYVTPLVGILIPSSAVPDSCYRITVTRTDVTPVISSDTSICFSVIHCPNTITTLQPIVLSVPSDTICVNSVIDVPFLSTGVFTNNSYIAQLSDSSGKFTNPINILGSLHSSQTYPGPPGTVSGKIVAISQVIPPGCNYYIRVISTSPADTGNTYGPFCIRDCNLQTNNTNDISLCIPPGVDSCFPVQLNHYFDSTLTYSGNNKLEIEVHSSIDFSLLNIGGLGGIVVSDKDTCLSISIPTLSYFESLGLSPGLYYIRVVADSSSEPWNNLGTLIRLTVGAPFPSPLTVLFYNSTSGEITVATDTSICLNNVIDFLLTPDNTPNSTYEWRLGNNTQFQSGDFLSIDFNGSGVYGLSVVETNYGCVGPGSDTVNINVLGLPTVTIIGPTQACVGDTIHYSAPLEDNTYYTWSSPTGNILDTANNNLNIIFTQAGLQKVSVHALGVCGFTDQSKNINVKANPIVNAGNDTTICQYDDAILSTPSGPYLYLWSNGATTQSTTVYPDTTTTYIITATLTGTLACPVSDTVTVFVKDAPPTPNITTVDNDTLYCTTDTSYISYQWYNDTTLIPGATDSMLVIHGGGNFNVKVTNRNGCSIAVGINIVGIQEFTNGGLQFTISPNPTGNWLTITTNSKPETRDLDLGIYNVLGQNVLRQQLETKGSKQETLIDVSSLSSGVYFIQLSNQSGKSVGRFVKE